MGEGFLPYQRAKFATRLPRNRLFTHGHFWLGEQDPGTWHVGFTRFATRMLGEVVEYDFEVPAGQAVEPGQVVGWVEGFKAVSELYAPMAGTFGGANPQLAEVVSEVHKDPYQTGWLYRIHGSPPGESMDAAGYARFLDDTIDRMTGKEAP